MDQQQFQQWLDDYGKAWEYRDAGAFVCLFTPECLYYWTPFGEPKRGRAEIAKAFTDATNTQEGIRFEYEVLFVDSTGGVAHWWCTFTRRATNRVVKLDGMLMVKGVEESLCGEFREWWHSDEAS